MCKHKSKNGFTLAELLIVVAIIAVLVAISIPVFTAQLKKARLAVDHTAVRDAYAIVQIANNLQEVEIEGTKYSFDELASSSISKVFYLSKNCSSLLKSTGLTPPDDAYRFQETGTNGSGECDGCVHVDPPSYTDNFAPISTWHYKDSPIYICFVNNQLVLGYALY